MAPTAVFDSPTHTVSAQIADLKAKAAAKSLNGLEAKVVDGKVKVQHSPSPLADDYMYDFQYNHSLPTHDALGVAVADDVDATKVAESLVAQLSDILGSGKAQEFADLFIEYGQSFRPRARLSRPLLNFKQVSGVTSSRSRGTTEPLTSARTSPKPPRICSPSPMPKTSNSLPPFPTFRDRTQTFHTCNLQCLSTPRWPIPMR